MITQLVPVEYGEQRVLTTQQLADGYGIETRRISENFNANKGRYQEGKHYYCLEGEIKREFLNRTEITYGSKNAKTIYLWTEKGALLHAKSLNTDVAWEIYDRLVETYFRAKEMQTLPTGQSLIAIALIEADKIINKLQLQTKQQEQIIGKLKPKADYADRILQSKGTVTVTSIAKDYGMTGAAFNKLLHDLKVQYKQGNIWLLYKEHQSKGYTHSKSFDYEDSQGLPQVRMSTEWTQKGRLFLYELLKDHNILPMIERDSIKTIWFTHRDKKVNNPELNY